MSGVQGVSRTLSMHMYVYIYMYMYVYVHMRQPSDDLATQTRPKPSCSLSNVSDHLDFDTNVNVHSPQVFAASECCSFLTEAGRPSYGPLPGISP